MGQQQVTDRGHRTLRGVFRKVVLARVLVAVPTAALGASMGFDLPLDLMPAGVRPVVVVAAAVIAAYIFSALTTTGLGLRGDDHLVRALLWRWAGHRFGGSSAHRFLESRSARWGVRRLPWVVLGVSALAVGVWGAGPVNERYGLDLGVVAVAARAGLFVAVSGVAVLMAVLVLSVLAGMAKLFVDDLTFLRPFDPESGFLRKILPPRLLRGFLLAGAALAVGAVLELLVDSEPFQLALVGLLVVGTVAMAAWVVVTMVRIDQRYGALAPLAALAAAMAFEAEMTPFDLPAAVSAFIVAGNLAVTGFAAAYAGVTALAGHRSRAAALIRQARDAHANLLDGQRRHGVSTGSYSSRWTPGRARVPALLRAFGAEYASSAVCIAGLPPGYERWWQQVVEHYDRYPRAPGAVLYVLTVTDSRSLHSGLKKLQNLQEHLAGAGPVVQGRDTVGFLVVADYLDRVGVEGFQRRVEAAWPVPKARWSGPEPVGVSDRILRMHLHR
ncbi:hypothetical protein RCG67_05510 [Kocuria sp. CPCC 205292]|uniref:hypothetical protein n=1 Tax=Kocuria cellulosilytica TaxID=3071451 RepID=UPI0034D42ACA